MARRKPNNLPELTEPANDNLITRRPAPILLITRRPAPILLITGWPAPIQWYSIDTDMTGKGTDTILNTLFFGPSASPESLEGA